MLLSNKSLQSLQPILLSGPELEATEEKEGTAVGWGEVGSGGEEAGNLMERGRERR